MCPLVFHYFSLDDCEALEARGAVESPGEPHSAPPSEIKVLKLHPGTPTVNHKQDSKVAEMEVNAVLQNQVLYVAPLPQWFIGRSCPFFK